MHAAASVAPRACHVCRPGSRPARPDSRVDAVRAPIGGVRRSDDGVRVSSRGSPVRPVRAGEGAVSEASTGAFDPIARLPRHQTSRSRSYPSETRPGPICVSSRGPRPIVGKKMGPTSDFTSSSVLATSATTTMYVCTRGLMIPLNAGRRPGLPVPDLWATQYSTRDF